MPDALRRAIRTFVQAFTGVILAQVGGILLDINQGTWIPDLQWLQRIGLSATIAGVIALVTFAQNWAEDNVAAVPAVLKSTPSSGENPVTQDPPT